MARSRLFSSLTIIIALISSSLSLVNSTSLTQSGAERLPDPETWKSADDLDLDDDDMGFIQKLIAGIVTFVIVVVAICLILCFCCPICIIAKMRQRRGVVIRTTTSPSANGQTVTVNVHRSVPASASNFASPQVVAIPNNLNANQKPYPVQESVTVVPLLQQQQQPVHYPVHSQPMNLGYPSGPAAQYPQNFELPPPYPGLPRESDSSNLPYNPYFTGEGATPSAPPPK